MKAKDVLNVRADSSEDAEIIGMLDKGDKVTRVRVLDNGWAEIKYGEATGYVLNKYLKDVSKEASFLRGGCFFERREADCECQQS
ncbi:MAG: SH3 domain-containing protein [Lachnospiraceae bacterium]